MVNLDGTYIFQLQGKVQNDNRGGTQEFVAQGTMVIKGTTVAMQYDFAGGQGGTGRQAQGTLLTDTYSGAEVLKLTGFNIPGLPAQVWYSVVPNSDGSKLLLTGQDSTDVSYGRAEK